MPCFPSCSIVTCDLGSGRSSCMDTISCQEIFFIADSIEVKERPFRRARSFHGDQNAIDQNVIKLLSCWQLGSSPARSSGCVPQPMASLELEVIWMGTLVPCAHTPGHRTFLPSCCHLGTILPQYCTRKRFVDFVWQFSCVCVRVRAVLSSIVNEVTGEAKCCQVFCSSLNAFPVHCWLHFSWPVEMG